VLPRRASTAPPLRRRRSPASPPASRPRRPPQTNDATFDHKLLPLYEGEKYIDPLRLKLQAEAEKKKGAASDLPFRMTNPMKESPGKGDYYATFGKIPYITPNANVGGKKKGDATSELRGIFTSPSKRGTFGYPKTTLSQRVGAAGVAGEYAYVADPIREAKRQPPSTDSKDPFRPVNPPKKYTAGMAGRTLSEVKKEFKGKGVAGEYEYVHQGPPTKGALPEPLANPFKPPSTTKVGKNATLNKFPLYLADPEGAKLERSRAAREAEMKQRLDNAWRPSAQTKTDATRSIMRMNLR